MHLVIVPRVGTGVILDPYRPMLPLTVRQRPHGWGQASSKWERLSKVACWVRATPAELSLIAANGRVVDRCCPDAESDRLVSAFRAGDVKSARDEFVSCYRGVCAPEEGRLASDGLLAALLPLVAAFGIAAAARLLGLPEDVALALTLLHADNFNRANGSLSGATMSDGVGAWTQAVGTWSVVSNQANGDYSDLGSCYDHVMSAVDVQRSSAVIATMDTGVGTRHPGGAQTKGYAAYLHWSSGGLAILRVDSHTGFTALTGYGTSGVGQTIAIDSSGSSHTAFINGAVEQGPVTDTTYATGRAWMLCGGSGSRRLDDFQVEVADVAGQPAIKRAGGVPFMHGGSSIVGPSRRW